ncbi:related to Vacuolar basic amino acid transporter 1 [Saccharomycodes ludwigii]|uniref:Related to Vacuolar basic amino acid transporter 1 n=1 Tax=Saccharomycodes ludwigii TaxID=36035 RepID=A0A376BC04_9ASCO|nr:hypothetical protein SCDLUD_004024 [Saccharomycodes ludwigii]KAH3899738.1 hypothetical protein SCDLUD_004024 [Saccharomycodes ludwigii]SSD62157.1 related to Vacuolar basic amino acid transporter 1 [Saccharomycodes ludwigii]
MSRKIDEQTPILIRSTPNDSEDEPRSLEELEQIYHRENLNLTKYPILISLWLGSFLASLDNTIVANIMNKVAEEFHESEKKQWIATSFLLTNTAFQPLYGKLSDVTGRKFALVTAHIFFLLGCFLTTFSNDVFQFSLFRAVCGFGAGGISAMSSIIVSDICTAKERGVYQGYANLVFALGQFLGAPLGGFLIDSIGWRIIFAAQVPAILLCLLLAVKNINIKLAHVPKHRFTWDNMSRIDFGGSLTLVCTIGGILFMCSTNWNKLFLAISTLFSLSLFIINELYLCKEQILPFKKVWSKFGVTSILTLFSSFIAFGEIFRTPIFLQTVQNFSTSKTGIFLIFTSISSPVASLFTGWVLRRTRLNLEYCSYLLLFFSFIIQILGLSLELFVVKYLEPSHFVSDAATGSGISILGQNYLFPSGSFLWKVLLCISNMLIMGGYSMLLVSTLVSIVFTVEKSQQGTFTGLFYLWRSIGNVLGASLTLTVFDRSLLVGLWRYLKDQPELFDSLIHDSSNIRKLFSGQKLLDILNIYNNSIIISYIPAYSLCLFSFVISFIFIRYFTRLLVKHDSC